MPVPWSSTPVVLVLTGALDVAGLLGDEVITPGVLMLGELGEAGGLGVDCGGLRQQAQQAQCTSDLGCFAQSCPRQACCCHAPVRALVREAALLAHPSPAADVALSLLLLLLKVLTWVSWWSGLVRLAAPLCCALLTAAGCTGCSSCLQHVQVSEQ